jgi:quercetin dioxygenase-like cupin family protein
MSSPESVFRSNWTIPGCTSTITTMQPADSLSYHKADWAGVVVVVVSGRLQLECWSGERASFDEGAVLFLTGLNLRHLTNPGLDPLVLKLIKRDLRK